MKNLLRINIIIILLFVSIALHSYPFFGGYYFTDNYFDKDSFTTSQNLAFYLDNKFSDYAKFYFRVTGGFKYEPEYTQKSSSLSDMSFMPSVDMLYFEFKKPRAKEDKLIDKKVIGETNFDLFLFRIGRINVSHGSGFFFNTYGDGIDTNFTVKNFRFRFFTVTNSFNYLQFFDFIDNGNSKPTFTNWDRKRVPALLNIGNVDEGFDESGFNSDITSGNYNFYFDDKDNTDDYTDKEKARLNNLRRASILAGRIFAGFSFEAMQIFNQNFTFSFLANIDLVPYDLIITYPKMLNNVENTFAGRYTSFYVSFNANGKIIKDFYYNLEAVYETGFNTTYYDTGKEIALRDSFINSFAINCGLNYYFNHKTKPMIGFNFIYANGDDDVVFKNSTVFNKSGDDNNYKSPSQPSIGYALAPGLSNLIVISLNHSIKPLIMLKNEIFSRFFVESALLFILRPNIKGDTIFEEKAEYASGDKFMNPEKAFLGAEIDLNASWQIFSDLSFQLKGGVLIPNYTIYAKQDVFWKLGLSLNISF